MKLPQQILFSSPGVTSQLTVTRSLGHTEPALVTAAQFPCRRTSDLIIWHVAV